MGDGLTTRLRRWGAAIVGLVAEPAPKSSRAETRQRTAASFERLKAMGAELQLAGDLKAMSRAGLD